LSYRKTYYQIERHEFH